MRMWMSNPHMMCRKHLLGEHVETHMFWGSLTKHKNLEGYIDKGLFEFKSLKSRHDVLAAEMEARGYKHESPMIDIWGMSVSSKVRTSIVNPLESTRLLLERCPACRARKDAIDEIALMKLRIQSGEFDE